MSLHTESLLSEPDVAHHYHHANELELGWSKWRLESAAVVLAV